MHVSDIKNDHETVYTAIVLALPRLQTHRQDDNKSRLHQNFALDTLEQVVQKRCSRRHSAPAALLPTKCCNCRSDKGQDRGVRHEIDDAWHRSLQVAVGRRPQVRPARQHVWSARTKLCCLHCMHPSAALQILGYRYMMMPWLLPQLWQAGGHKREARPCSPLQAMQHTGWRRRGCVRVVAPGPPQHALLRVVQHPRVVHRAVARPDVLRTGPRHMNSRARVHEKPSAQKDKINQT